METQNNVQPPKEAPATPPPATAQGSPTPPVAGGEVPAPAADPNSKEGRASELMRAREAKLVRDQQAFARQRDEFESYKRQTQADVDAARALKERLKADALGVAREYGWDDDRLAARWVNGNKPTQLDADAHVRQELSELRQWRQQQEQARAQQEHQRAQEAARNAFHTTAQDASRWKLASQLKKDRLVARGEAIAIEHARAGVQLSDEDILDRVEEELEELLSIQSNPKQATSEANGKAPQAQTGTDTQPAPTLTNGKAAEVAGQQKRPPVNLSFAEERKLLMESLKEGRAKGLIKD